MASTPLSLNEALMKSIDLIIGVLKETRARRTVAVRVTRNPGVAGFIVVV